MRNKKHLIRIIIFFIAIALPFPLWQIFASAEVSSAEKRELAEMPSLSFETYASFSKDYESYVNDHLPLRDSLITAYSSVLYNALGTSSNKDVIVGKDGWLFYDNKEDGDPMGSYRGEDLFTVEELAQITDNLISSRDALAREGRSFTLLLIPSKERVYSEYMPDYIGPPAENYAVLQLYNHLKTNTDLDVLYVYDDIMNEKTDIPQRRLFYKGDSHWTHYGAYVASHALLNDWGFYSPAPHTVELIEEDTIHDDNDLSMFLHLEKEQTEKIYKVSKQSYNTKGLEFLGEEDGARHHKDNAPGGRLYVVQDSFYNYMRSYVANQFTDVLSEGINFDTPVFSARLRDFNPDTVLYQTAERRLRDLLTWRYE